MDKYLDRLDKTVQYLQSKTEFSPKIGIILGSGLGNLANEIKVEWSIPYTEIPDFPVSTVKGHQGALIFGYLNGVPVMVMKGRFHFYEGYSPLEVVYPIRVMHQMGVKTLLLSNAAGAVNPDYKVGDLMIIKDHIGLFVPNPLIGKNEELLGTRFPDMSEPYAKDLIKTAKLIAAENHIPVFEGVYTAVTGPSFETHAEYRMIKTIGSDVVGMSTVQETTAAVHCGMKVFAISVVTDIGIRTDENLITHEEVLAAAQAAEPKLTLIFKTLVKAINNNY